MAAAAAAAALQEAWCQKLDAKIMRGDVCHPSKRYRKYELIGQGAQKKVYRAFDEEKGIEVAWNEVAVAELARFREKDQQRVFAEIRVLKQLKHKNIMRLHDYWFDEKRFMLVFITEIFPDGTLRQYRRRHKHAEVSAIKRWAWQILQGLVYLHGHNPPIIHRDLKCDNIFVSGSSGIVKIGDLGLVTLCKDLSAPQSVLGTPEFMAPELYEEKYDEKVDVYAFGMCLLELATMEYPYAECKNAAQIYKKVTQGIPPASVEKLASVELRDFIMLCLCHDPLRRPEARHLLKHSFFEAIRAEAASAQHSSGPTKLMTVTSLCLMRSVSVGTPSSSKRASPTTLSRAASACSTFANGLGSGHGSSVDIALAHINGVSVAIPTPAALYGSIAAAAGGSGICLSTSPPVGSIAAAACGSMGLGTSPPVGSIAVAAMLSPSLNSRSSSFDMERPPPLQIGRQSQPLASVAAALAQKQMSPGCQASTGARAGFAASCGFEVIPGVTARGSCGGASAASDGRPPSPIIGTSPPAGGGISSALRSMVPPFPIADGAPSDGRCSIASSLSPSAAADGISTTLAGTLHASSPTSPDISVGGSPCVISRAGSSGGAMGVVAATPGGGYSPVAALTAGLHSPSPQGHTALGIAGGAVGPTRDTSLVSDFAAAATTSLGAAVPAVSSSASVGTSFDTGNSRRAGGISSSAAAIAAAAVSAAAAAVASGSVAGPGGLPSILEDHELHEDMMFDQEEIGGRGYSVEDDDDSESCDGDLADERPTSVAVPSCGNGRSQPVNLKVRSSGQAAATNMALSFAMSFTNQRGVRKKVGFQYDLLHDTASAIAVEMVENLSLNTAEAEAIAAMIQHEVSRFNQQQGTEHEGGQEPQA